MEDKNLQQENQYLQSQVEYLKSKLNAIEKSNQQKSKFQLWLGRAGFSFLLGPGLKSSMQQLYKELPANVKRDTLADVTTQVIWRFTRIGLLAVFMALIPTVLLWQQNEKIDEQTKLFEKQNEKIDNQIQLEESNRRGALIVMMSNIMDKVDEEIRKAEERGDSSRTLSPQLIGRIGALSHSFRPYRFWQDSTLTKIPFSPERGQLLSALVQSRLNSNTYKAIYEEATFESAFLEKANLKNKNLINTILSRADLSYSFLVGTEFTDTDLSYANFTSANVAAASLHSVRAEFSNFSKTILVNTDFSSSKLNNTNFINARLSKTNLSYASLINADFRYAFLDENNFKGANFTGVDLTTTFVTDIHWINQLEKYKVVGLKEIIQKYEVDISSKLDTLNKIYYPIIQKK